MNKFTKISAAALFALFLTACDKPASKAAEAPKAEAPKTEMAQPAEAPKAEAAPAATEAAKADSAVDAQGVEDFKKLVEWNQAQEKGLEAAQAELQQKVATQDKAQIEAGLTAFKNKVDEVLKSLDGLEVKNADVNGFKAKMKETLVLSNELIQESVKTMAAPSPEAQSAIQKKSEELIKAGTELQKLQGELQAKFGAK